MENSEKASRFYWKACIKSFSKVLFSHIGTLLMLILYLIMGGYLFNYLEAQNEVLICKDRYDKFSIKLTEVIERVSSISNSGEQSDKIRTELQKTLVLFSSDVFKLQYEPGKNCSTIGQPGNWHEWNIFNSIFFCVTVVTTIGYGNITPKTKWGKINSMIYSIFGIPLLLLFMSNVGELMARFFRYIYLNLCCCRCFIRPQHFEDADTIELVPNDTRSNEKEPPQKMIQEPEIEYHDDNTFVVIPITVVLLVLFAYIVLGAALFRIWEEDWDMVDGTYFSFITLATIGFGDLVLFNLMRFQHMLYQPQLWKSSLGKNFNPKETTEIVQPIWSSHLTRSQAS